MTTEKEKEMWWQQLTDVLQLVGEWQREQTCQGFAVLSADDVVEVADDASLEIVGLRLASGERIYPVRGSVLPRAGWLFFQAELPAPAGLGTEKGFGAVRLDSVVGFELGNYE